MRMSQVRRLSSFNRLVYWINERESIRRKKEAGQPMPWTDDVILRTYRFCNVRRMDDKVSRWLLENWYQPYRDHPNMLAAVALARFINKPESLEALDSYLFPSLEGRASVDWKGIKKSLRRTPRPVFNAAYMVRGNTTKSPDKIGTVVDECAKELVKSRVEIDTFSMETTHGRIAAAYGFGSFMAGQVVADLRWALTGKWIDRNDWAPVGPGSARGLARLLYKDEWDSAARDYVSRPDNFLFDFRPLIDRLRNELPASITDRIEAHDYQNCLCEYDKYVRTLNDEGKPKQLYRRES